MPVFRIAEVRRTVETQHYIHTVEAEDEDAALSAAYADRGESEEVEQSEHTTSGWAVVGPDEDDEEALAAAEDELDDEERADDSRV